MKIGIIGAMEPELTKEQMTIERTYEQARGVNLLKVFGRSSCCCCTVGNWHVNAAACTQILIDTFAVTACH